jgi:cytochrome c
MGVIGQKPSRSSKEGLFMLRKSLITLALLASSVVAAQAAGDAKAGAAVFKRCAVCHTSDKGGGDGLGPNLFGVVGRKAATRAGYAYSGPLQRAGVIWTEANLTKWVAGPARVAPGNKMAFPGITSKKQQADVVAYLGTLK